jgi:hypothetical protein
MNKLANTYLDSVDSLLSIHQAYPGEDDFYRILCDLSSAMRALNEDPDHHEWTSNELAKQDSVWIIGDCELRLRKIIPK